MNQQPDSNPSQARTAVQGNLRYTATLVRDSNDAIMVQDFTGRISTWNHGAELMYGYSNAEALQMTIWRLVPPGKVAGLKEIMRRLMAGEWIASFATQRMAKDGQILDVWLTVTKLVDGDGRPIGIASTGRDITVAKLATDLQLASELRYRRLFETAEDGILILDAATGLIVDVNPFLIDLLGYSRTMFLGKKLWEVGLFKDIAANQAKFAELQAHEHIRYEDLPLKTSDGRPIEVEFVSTVYEVNGGKVIQCNIRDITLRKRMEAALAKGKNEFSAMFEMASIGMAQADPQTGRWLRVNQKLCTITGYTKAELLQMRIAELTHPDDRQPDAAAFQRVVRGEAPDYRMEKRYLRKDGTEIWVNVNMTVIRDAAGQPTRTMTTIEDITARKRVEEELRQTQHQVIEQEKLRVLGQMASGIAHDFNNALAPIVGFSELLLKHPEKLADQQLVVKYLQHINTCGTDAARVVRQMREFSRQRATVEEYRPLDLNKLVRQTIEYTQQRWKDQAQAAGQTIQIVTDLLPVQQITGEESAIRELLTNLIFNAVDALPAGGKITLGTMLDGQWVRLSVSDTGTGMTEEVRRRCLEPFFTTKGTEGSGLGLAMVQGIVQRHNGTLDIESQVGQGTTFIIRLPLQHGAPPPVPLKVSALSRSLHVLVVDDEPLVRAVAEAWLIEDKHTVETAENGAAALRRLKHGQFDLVITDKAMPEMNGEQLAAAIYEGETIVPVILMTGFGDLMKAAGELPPHISAILSKPITQVSLRAALAKVFPS